MAKRTDELPKKRMTGKDYGKELKELNKSILSLKAHIEARLLELIAKYPEAVVVDKGISKFLCRHITKIWFQDLSLETKIAYIEAIEKWSADQEKITQGEIDYKPGWNID